MKVILLQDVPKVGHKFDVVDVASGYASNFLIPQKLAEPASAHKVAELGVRKEAARVAEDARIADLKEKLASLTDVTLTLTAKADDQGHLYKKIHAADIVKALKDEYDIHVHKESLLLEEPIHTTGDFEVPIEAADTRVTLTVQVVAE